MVRAAFTLAVLALGAASVLAQSIDNNLDLETREIIAEVDARDYVDEVDARELLEEYSDVNARDDEVFGDLEARDVEEVFEYLRDVSAPAASTPTATVTVTHTKLAKPTGCSNKQLRKMKHNHKVLLASKTLRAAQLKKPTTLKEKMQARRAKSILRKHIRKQARSKKIAARKARYAKKKAARVAAAKARAAAKAKASAPTATGATKATVAAASKITQAPVVKNNHKKSKKNSRRVSKKVGKDGVTTVHVTTTAAAPSCSAPSSFRKSLLKQSKMPRDFDEELGSLFERETEFDELD